MAVVDPAEPATRAAQRDSVVTGMDLSGIYLLSTAADEAVRNLADKCRWQTFADGEVVIEKDDASTDVFFVVRGKLRVMTFIADTESGVTLMEMGHGDTVGEMAIIDGQRRSARATAEGGATLAILRGADFKSFLMENPQVALVLLEDYAFKIRELNSRVAALGTLSPDQRVYHELARISHPSASGDGTWVINNLPGHSELALATGTDRQLVAEVIGAMVREGLAIRRHKHLIIRDQMRLRALARD